MAFTAEAVAAEMQQHVQAVVALAPEDSRKAALTWTARAMHLPFSRIKHLFYGEARRIEAHEADQIRAYVEAAENLIKARADYDRQRREFLEAHPSMARLVPNAVAGDALSTGAAATGSGEVKR